MLNVRLVGGHLYGKQLFTWLSLVVSLVASFCAVLFPTRCLGWDLRCNWVSFWGISYPLFYFTPKLVWTKTKELLANEAQKAAAIILCCKENSGFPIHQMPLNFLTPWLSLLNVTVLKFWGVSIVKKLRKYNLNSVNNLYDYNKTQTMILLLENAVVSPLQLHIWRKP